MSKLQEIVESVAFDQGHMAYQVKAKQAKGLGRPVLNVYVKPMGASRGKHVASILMDQCGPL